MAFRLPQAPPRRQSYTGPERLSLDLSLLSQQPDDDAQQWVLFSPTQTPSTLHTGTDSTSRTAGLSRLSDFGSFSAGTQADNNEQDEPADEDATELDSLDEGLQEFPHAHVADSSRAVLPTHDGLGSFHNSNQFIQNQLWQYEQYNPGRPANVAHTRRSSVQRHLDSVEEQEMREERERWQRIEKWRIEQSRILLEEIERETRRLRRRNSRASVSAASRRSGAPALDSISETAVMETAASASEASSDQGDTPEESIWRKITRKVIRDLIGIDESLLSVILGESLAGSTSGSTDPEGRSETGATEMNRELQDAPSVSESGTDGRWPERILHRIARELGILVHQLCEHPGAFTTYLRIEDPRDYYAGIPVSSSESNNSSQLLPTTSDSADTSAAAAGAAPSTFSPHFTPTIRDPAVVEHAAQWGIEEEEDDPSPSADPVTESVLANREREFWERELDMAMVFRYLRSRFRRTNNDNRTPSSSSPSRREHSQDSANNHGQSHPRAAVIRQHHPLVARAHARHQATQRQNNPSLRTQFPSSAAAAAGPSSPITRHRFRRPSSSCASQSTKVSLLTHTHTAALGSGSSRHYWDIGGSVGSGSAVVSVGGGADHWGEV
ncbi:hypothetical protein VTN49DRAFT_3455 [Thermomyces lanuginosus]|uniref:uncharacterized protein n=1 Tax=Thermomyces lanuginosus TaxID=5541 RepID=UPI00374305FF